MVWGAIDFQELFLWMTIVGGGLYLFTVMMVVKTPKFMFKFHERLFGITRSQFNVAIYGYLALFKILYIVFIVIPFIALLIID